MSVVAAPDPGAELRHRLTETVVTVHGDDGAPLAGTAVTVEQTRHALGLGNIGFDLIPLANGETRRDPVAAQTFGGASLDQLEHLAELWLEVFNTATLPFYWGAFEPRRGAPDTERLRRAAQWFADRGVARKGHPLLWHTLTAPWLRDLPTEEVERVQRERIRREVGGFAGLIDTWDAINEAVMATCLFVIRTEKRRAIDADGKPLFRPRYTQIVSSSGTPRGAAGALRGRHRVRARGVQPGAPGEAHRHRVPDDPDAAAGDVEHGRHPDGARAAPRGAGAAFRASSRSSARTSARNGSSSTGRTRWSRSCRAGSRG